MVHPTLHAGADRTVDTTSCGITHVTRNEGSINLVQGTKPTFRGNLSDGKHSKVGYEIPSGNTKGDRIHTPEVLPPRIINTEVDNCNSASGFKSRICNVQFIDRVGFINKSEDTQDSCCPRLEDKSLSKHICFKTEIPH